MINKNTGNIKLTDSLELTPKSNLNLLEGQNLGQANELRDIGNGCKWLDIKNINIGSKYFIISLCFIDELLSELSLLVSDERFSLSSHWSSWSERKEKEDLKKYTTWLNKELGGKTEFHWGDVWATYDPKSGSSSIGIRYK
ncbi:MAG: hypothetical protein Roseis2KO_56650 [Roseivirga sp.]